jgi:hypothetical protein
MDAEGYENENVVEGGAVDAGAAAVQRRQIDEHIRSRSDMFSRSCRVE